MIPSDLPKVRRLVGATGSLADNLPDAAQAFVRSGRPVVALGFRRPTNKRTKTSLGSDVPWNRGDCPSGGPSG
jgi:hypothetical protein